MFKVMQAVVYPGHGVARVTQLETKEILGKTHKFYCLETTEGMKILVPVNDAEKHGIRPIVSRAQAVEVFEYLNSETKVKVEQNTWNRRYREYMETIKTGDLMAMAKVLKTIAQMRDEGELSFGERKMLETVKNQVRTELKMALGDSAADIN